MSLNICDSNYLEPWKIEITNHLNDRVINLKFLYLFILLVQHRFLSDIEMELIC